MNHAGALIPRMMILHGPLQMILVEHIFVLFWCINAVAVGVSRPPLNCQH
jgi:hypothetical protein